MTGEIGTIRGLVEQYGPERTLAEVLALMEAEQCENAPIFMSLKSMGALAPGVRSGRAGA